MRGSGFAVVACALLTFYQRPNVCVTRDVVNYVKHSCMFPYLNLRVACARMWIYLSAREFIYKEHLMCVMY